MISAKKLLERFKRCNKPVFIFSISLVALFIYTLGAKSIVISGSDLSGNVGLPSESDRVAKDKKDAAGCLTYGPYVTLPEGTYRFNMQYTATSEANGAYDIVYRGATSLERSGGLVPKNQGWVSEKVHIKSDDSDKVWEFRSWYSGKGNLIIHKIIINGFAGYPLLSAIFQPDFITILPNFLKIIIESILIFVLFLITFISLDYLRVLFTGIIFKYSKIPLTRESKIDLISLIILVGFLVSAFYHYIMGIYLKYPYPYNTFLFDPVIKFSDFFLGCINSKNLNNYWTALPSCYFPFANIIIFLFSLINKWVSFFMFLSICTISLIIYNRYFLKTSSKLGYFRNVFIFSFLTYPFLFCLDRGNFEGILFVFLIYFMIFYIKERLFISAIFLSMAIAMKAYPAVFLVLFIADKKYKHLIFSLGFTVLITMLSLIFHAGGFIKNLNHILSGFGNSSIIPLERGTSLATLARVIFIHTNADLINIPKFMNYYILFALITFVLISIYIILFERELWKRVALLVFIMLLLPNISYDYKLVHIFLPLMLFINTKSIGKNDFWYALMFALLLIPKDYRIPLDQKILVISIVSMFSNIFIIISMMLMIVFSGISAHLKHFFFSKRKERFS